MDLGLKGRKAIVCGSSRGLCATALAREVCSVVINGLDAERLARAADEIRTLTGAAVTLMAERMMKLDNITREEARRRQAESLPAKRLGTPEEFGDACAYLCSAPVGFITGQNLQLDGGAYPGLI